MPGRLAVGTIIIHLLNESSNTNTTTHHLLNEVSMDASVPQTRHGRCLPRLTSRCMGRVAEASVIDNTPPCTLQAPTR